MSGVTDPERRRATSRESIAILMGSPSRIALLATYTLASILAFALTAWALMLLSTVAIAVLYLMNRNRYMYPKVAGTFLALVTVVLWGLWIGWSRLGY